MSAAPRPSPSPARCDGDHPQVLVGAAGRMPLLHEPGDRLDPLVVGIHELPQLYGLVLAALRMRLARYRQPQRARRAVLGEVDTAVGEHGVGEGGHQLVVSRTAVLGVGEDPAADRIVLEGLVQQPDDQLSVALVRRPYRHAHDPPL